MKSKPTSKNFGSPPLKPHKNKISKKHKIAKKLNAAVKNNLLENNQSSKFPKNGNKHRNSEDGNSASSKSPSSISSVSSGNFSFSGPSTSKKKRKNRRKSNVNASVGDGNDDIKSSSNVSSMSGGNSAVNDANLSSRGPLTLKKKNMSRRKFDPPEDGYSVVNDANRSFSEPFPPMENKKKIRKSDMSAPEEDWNSVKKSSSTTGSVNGGSFRAATTIKDGDASKNRKKKRSKKKRRSGDNSESEAQNAVFPKTSAKTSSEDSGNQNARKVKKISKGKAGESPNPAHGSLADKRESGVCGDQKLISNGKQKREKFKNSKSSSLREKMLSRLSAARFRFINEELYTWDGHDSPEVFASDPKSFKAYHSGFKQQTKLWPINPIDTIIKSIKKVPGFEKKVIADFGCGEAKLALELSSNKVYSFDLVAINSRVTVCDNANTKLYSGSVDIAVHCLSLMSSNISGYIKEANRVLKIGGLLKIAEVESRFEDVEKFAENVCKFNFKLLKKDLTHNLFYFMDFEKVADIGVARKRKLPVLSLQPCLYKKR